MVWNISTNLKRDISVYLKIKKLISNKCIIKVKNEGDHARRSTLYITIIAIGCNTFVGVYRYSATGNVLYFFSPSTNFWFIYFVALVHQKYNCGSSCSYIIRVCTYRSSLLINFPLFHPVSINKYFKNRSQWAICDLSPI